MRHSIVRVYVLLLCRAVRSAMCAKHDEYHMQHCIAAAVCFSAHCGSVSSSCQM